MNRALLLLCALPLGCFFPDVSLDDRRCEVQADCLVGFACAGERCVPVGLADAGPLFFDAGQADAGPVPDAGAPDNDAGAPVDDAGVPVDAGVPPGPSDPVLVATIATDGVLATLSVDASDLDADLATLNIQWGDGQSEDPVVAGGSFIGDITHEFTSLNTFSVLVTLTDAAGANDADTLSAVIEPPRDLLELEYQLAAPLNPAADSSGDGRDGNVEISDDCTALDVGHDDLLANQSYSFNQLGGSCQVDAHGRIVAPHVPHGESFSFSLWMDPEAQGNANFIMGQSSNANPSVGLYARLILGDDPVENAGASDRITFLVEHPAGFVRVTDPGALVNLTWDHYAGVVDFDNNSNTTAVRLYRNGVEVGTAASFSGSSLNPNAADPFVIGDADPNGGFRGYKGRMDVVRVYDRALTPNEIKLLALE